MSQENLILIECTQLVAVQGFSETMHHVVFQADAASRKRIYAWRDSGERRRIRVSDCTGHFLQERDCMLLDVVESGEALQLTTFG